MSKRTEGPTRKRKQKNSGKSNMKGQRKKKTRETKGRPRCGELKRLSSISKNTNSEEISLSEGRSWRPEERRGPGRGHQETS